MHGAGNDYIYIDCFKEKIADPSALALKLSDRHKGIGGDGLVLINPSPFAHAEMRMFNADGTEAQMCGNAIRCVGKYLFDHGYVHEHHIQIHTLDGEKYLHLHENEHHKIDTVEVNMGTVSFLPKDLPMLQVPQTSPYLLQPLRLGNKTYSATAVSVGNPHIVLLLDSTTALDPKHFDLPALGKHVEDSPYFPEGVNTEIVKILDPHTIEMRVWERGTGETLACGTGSCASVSALVTNHLLPFDTPIDVKLLGGTLTITYQKDGNIMMEGEAVEVFTGEVDL